MKRAFIKIMLPVFMFIIGCTSSPRKNSRESPVNELAVIAYYSGNADGIDSFPVEKLTHIIFSFAHLRDNRLFVSNESDTATIKKLVSLKARNGGLKVILSLGGWGGCETCSPVFASASNRAAFSQSVKELTEYFKTDGIDLDWEYPAIEGYPGHAYQKEDKSHFTALVQSLRDSLGNKYEISFAAGGFDMFLEQSIEWDKVMPLLDKVNLMSYDLVGGYSKMTGHHTPLYSSKEQKQSADNAVRYLDSIGVSRNKIIIGAAFYARVWDSVANINHGLYQAGVFRSFIGYNQFSTQLNAVNGYTIYLDTVANASYAYNAAKKHFATFDDALSVEQKTRYVKQKGLGGIMFWELSIDKKNNGLLEIIDKVKKEK